MKTFYFIIILLISMMFSCMPVRYIHPPTLGSPCIGQYVDLPKRIIIAKDHHVLDLPVNSEKCIEGLISGIRLSNEVEIVEEINFKKEVDSTILFEVNSIYNADGLLLLINNGIEESITYAANAYMHIYPHSYGKKYYDNRRIESVGVYINSTWEYYDFRTNESFRFYVYNEEKYRPQTEDNYYLKRDRFNDAMLFNNGVLVSKELIGY